MRELLDTGQTESLDHICTKQFKTSGQLLGRM